MKLPTYKELAKYLKVSEQAVKQYPPKKRELMLYGLKAMQETTEANSGTTNR